MNPLSGQMRRGHGVRARQPSIAEDALRFFRGLVRFTRVDDLQPSADTGRCSVLLDDGQLQRHHVSAIAARYREFNRRIMVQLYGEHGRAAQVFDDADLLCSCLTHCKTLEHVLKTSACFDVSKALPQRTAIALRQEGERVVVALSTQLPGGAATPAAVAVDLLAVLFQYKLLSWLAGERLRLLDAALCQERAPDAALVKALEDIIRCPIRFGAKENALVFAREMLHKPVVRSHGELLDVLRSSQIALLPLPADQSHSEAVTALLRKALLDDTRPPTLDEVAARLGHSNSTLRRYLAREGTSFQELLDRCRHQRAVELLAQPLTLDEIAARLGFSAPSSFSYAFKAWTGEPPSSFRQKLRAV